MLWRRTFVHHRRGGDIIGVGQTDPAGVAWFTLTGPASGSIDLTVNQVQSNNLVAGLNYDIKIYVHNDTNFEAGNVDVKSGETAEFALTAYIRRKMIGGANFIIRKK